MLGGSGSRVPDSISVSSIQTEAPAGACTGLQRGGERERGREGGREGERGGERGYMFYRYITHSSACNNMVVTPPNRGVKHVETKTQLVGAAGIHVPH